MSKEYRFDIANIDRQFYLLGPTSVICKPPGFNRWCTLPYPDRPRGCPNFGRRSDCPPQASYFLDECKPEVLLACLDFDFKSYLEAKRIIHPDWTERARRNPRHYQNHLRGHLVNNVNQLLDLPEFRQYKPIYCPEAMGVNVHMTCQNTSIVLEWPPQNHMYRIALLALPK